MLGAPELDAGLQVGSDKSGVNGQNPLPRPAGPLGLSADINLLLLLKITA